MDLQKAIQITAARELDTSRARREFETAKDKKEKAELSLRNSKIDLDEAIRQSISEACRTSSDG